jgi:hypothetical protein
MEVSIENTVEDQIVSEDNGDNVKMDNVKMVNEDNLNEDSFTIVMKNDQNKEIKVNKKLLQYIQVCEEVVNGEGQDDPEDNKFDCLKGNSALMLKIIDILEYYHVHKHEYEDFDEKNPIPKPSPTIMENFRKLLPDDYFFKFLESLDPKIVSMTDPGELLGMVILCNYLNIQLLEDIIIAYISVLIKSKNNIKESDAFFNADAVFVKNPPKKCRDENGNLVYESVYLKKQAEKQAKEEAEKQAKEEAEKQTSSSGTE